MQDIKPRNKNYVVDLRKKQQTIDGINCPLCNQFVPFELFKGKHGEDEHELCIWSCPHCAFVGIEYNGQSDVKLLNERLLSHF